MWIVLLPVRCVVPRQVRADHFPTRPLVHRPEHHVGCRVQHVRVVWREHDRVVPLEPVPPAGDGQTSEVGPHGDDTHLLAGVVVPEHGGPGSGRASQCAGERDVRVIRLDRYVSALGAADRVAVRPPDRSPAGTARHTDRGVVLLRGVQPVRELRVRRDVVELAGRLVVDRRPRLAAVEGHACATVVAVDHAAGVVGVDPEIVVVVVGQLNGVERLSPVYRLPERLVEVVYDLGVPRVSEDMVVVVRTHRHLGVVVYVLPRLAVVVRPVQSARPATKFCQRSNASRASDVEDRPHPAGPCRCAGHADPPLGHVGKARVVRQVGPGVAPVEAPEYPAVRPATVRVPVAAACVPGRRVDDPRVGRVHPYIVRPGVLALEQHSFPRPPAVVGPEHPLLLVRPLQVPEHGGVYEVGIVRVDSQPRGVSRLLQPDVHPRPSRVGRPVHPVCA